MTSLPRRPWSVVTTCDLSRASSFAICCAFSPGLWKRSSRIRSVWLMHHVYDIVLANGRVEHARPLQYHAPRRAEGGRARTAQSASATAIPAPDECHGRATADSADESERA